MTGKKAKMNPECASCPLRLIGCGEIMQLWRERKLRRPEFMVLAGRLYAFHSGEMVCSVLKCNTEEIKKRDPERQREEVKDAVSPIPI